MNRLKFIFIFSFLVFFFSSCEDIFEEENGASVPEYFEFKVDGKQFESEGVPGQCSQNIFAYYPAAYMDLPEGYLLMGANNCSENTSLTLAFQGVIPEYTGTTSLENPIFADSFRPVFQFENNTLYNRLLDGSITIDSFSGSKKKSSGRLTGTFEMRLIDFEKTDTLTITDGRFSFAISQRLD